MRMNRMMGVAVAVVALGIFLSSFAAKASDVASIDVATLQSKMASQTPPLVLDVREPSETSAGVISGAKLIPLGELESSLSSLPKDKPIVVYCRSGNRSARAAAILAKNGFTQVENLTGGMTAWSSKCATNKDFC